MKPAIRAARAVLTERRARTTGETAYLVYVAVLVAALVAVPTAVTIVRSMTQPQVVTALGSPDSAGIVGMTAAALAAGALFFGRTRGPVVPSPFLTEFLAGSDLPRRVTTLRPFLMSAAVLACSAIAAAGLVVVARLLGGGAASVSAVLVVLGCLGYSGLLAVLWLIGQSVQRRITVSLALVVLASGAALSVNSTLPFTPWGWIALLWQGMTPGAPTAWWPVTALGLTSLALLGVPALLDILRTDEIMKQSRRWQSVSALVQTGDVAGASGALRDPPTRGRRRRMPLTGPLILVIMQRDLIAAGRFPVRIALGSLALVGAGWLTGLAPTVPGGVDWITALAGVWLAYLGVGVWCDGLRNAADNAAPGSLYGRSARTMMGCHAAVPTLAAITFGSLGAVGANAVWWMMLAIFIVLVRVLDCAKGPMPIGLLLPVPTPVGDVSILGAIAWQADALLIVLIVGGGLTVQVGAAGLGSTPWLCVAAAIVALLALRRIRALGR